MRLRWQAPVTNRSRVAYRVRAMGLSVERAIVEVGQLAREMGLEAEPVVIADRSNLVLRLDPHPRDRDGAAVVARVAMATSLVRVGMTWLRREVDLSRWLSERGGRVTRPSTRLSPGPFERSGLVISFWELETIVGERADPVAAGSSLADAHAHLASYPIEQLPEWGGVEEARQVLARARTSEVLTKTELRRLEAAWEKAEAIVASARSRSASFQAIHGDAHIGNVLATDRGPVWTDWEDAFVGPIEFDLACLRSKAELFGEERDAIEAMTGAYRASYDVDLVRDLGLVRNVQVILWLAVFAERHADLLPRMRARIERLPP
ncbi:MAG: aminoglycoside phosphotransferase family protein [Myxococcales bacterium]|nr:aminoglycoside phosphotransferase family protein [Myxococcales bacterium]